MNKLMKSIPAENGELYVTSAGRRQLLAYFDGNIEISERQAYVPILGTVQKGTKRIFASFVICENIDYQTEVSDCFIHSGKVYDAIADVMNEKITFAGLRFMDSDPIKNTLVFEITDLELVKRLIA